MSIGMDESRAFEDPRVATLTAPTCPIPQMD